MSVRVRRQEGPSYSLSQEITLKIRENPLEEMYLSTGLNESDVDDASIYAQYLYLYIYKVADLG